MLVYSESDWAGCLRTRKSTSGGGVDIPGGILKTRSSTQASIAQSSGEAEYYALVRAASEALGMKSIMHDLGWDCKIRLLVDSSAAKSIASRTGLGKLRHLEIKFLWLQECVRRGKVVMSKVRGDLNPADVLTKPKSLEDMRSLLNFSCIDWCDGRVPDNCYSGNRIEFENSIVRGNQLGDSSRGNHGFLNRCGDSGNRDFLNRCGNRNCGFLNCVGNRRIFRDGELKSVDSFGVSSLEYSRSGDRRYVVNSSTVRRRRELEFEQFVSDPAPNVCMVVITVGNIVGVLEPTWRRGVHVCLLDDKRA